MKKTINNIEIEYQKESQNFIDELIEYLLTQIEEIFNFFNFIPKKPIKIKIVPSIDELKTIYDDKVSKSQMPEWVVGFSTLDHIAHLLSYNEYKNTCHKFKTLEDYKKTLVHEVVHQIHDLYCGGRYTGTNLIWEGVAVYLSKQIKDTEENLELSKEKLLNNNCHMREHKFFFERLLNMYDHKTVLEILKGNKDEEEIIDEILGETKSK